MFKDLKKWIRSINKVTDKTTMMSNFVKRIKGLKITGLKVRMLG